MRASGRLLVVSLIASATLALAACGSSSSDSGPKIGPSACNVLAQTGCSAGQKCTWIQVTDTTGATGCVPEGSKAALQACTWGANGATTGYDNCVKGLTCLGGAPGSSTPGECRAACDSSATSACSANEACLRYSKVYDGTTPPLGLCEAQCNPLTQVRLTDGAAACGSPNPAAPTRGCYGVPSQDNLPTVFTCAMAGDPAKTHRVPAGDPIYVNSCAPGYLPLLIDSTGSTTGVCIALCSPVAAWQGNTAGLGGAPPHTCAAAGATGAGEECRFWWFMEGPTTPLSQWSNGLGYCFDHTRYTWDADNNPLTPDVTMPSCGALASTDTDGNGVADYLEWGCGPISSR